MTSSGRTLQTFATAPIAAPEAHLREAAELIDDLGRLLALLADVKDEVARLEYLVIVAALCVTVPAEHVQLAAEIGAGEEVAGLGVPRDQAQRLALARSADHDRRMRLRDSRRMVQRPLQLVVLAAVRGLVAAPHLPADLQRLLQPLESLGNRRERDAEAAGLLLVPGRADAQPGTTAG